MFKLLRKKVYPIGIDLGSHSLKMLQLAGTEGGLRIIAAARAVIPMSIREDNTALHNWYVDTIKEFLVSKPFKGRKAVTSLPTSSMIIQHLRMPKMDDEQLEKALPWQAQEKLPFDIKGAMLRHIVAGDIYEDDENKLEVILMAASYEVIQRHLHLVEQSKLEIESVNVEPCALLNNFSHLSNAEESQALMIVDLGHRCTKVVVLHGNQIAFCRTIHLGTEDIYQDLCRKLSADYNQVVVWHQNWSAINDEGPAASPFISGNPATVAGTSVAGTNVAEAVLPERINEIIGKDINHLATEIRSCARYHDMVFDNHDIHKVIFVGGPAKNKNLCQHLARELKLPAQLGDPLARVDAASRSNQPDLEQDNINSDWAIAFGLSVGKG